MRRNNLKMIENRHTNAGHSRMTAHGMGGRSETLDCIEIGLVLMFSASHRVDWRSAIIILAPNHVTAL